MALLWEMGTGKSMEAILWLRAKYNAAKDITPTLIISPVATLYNWENEFKLNAPEKVCAEVGVPYMRTRKTLYTLKERAHYIRTSGKRILVLNPASIDSVEVVAALREFAPQNVIIDEVHGWKSHKLGSVKKPTRLAKLLSITDKTKNCAVMTGTLLLKDYSDIWAPWRILDRGETFGTNYTIFLNKYFEDKNAAWRGKKHWFPNWQPKAECAEEVAEKIARYSSRVTKDECLDLPPLIFKELTVEMSPDQEKAYREIETELITEVREGVCAVSNALSKITRLLQILGGYVAVENETVGRLPVRFKSNPRLDELETIIKEQSDQHKIIVWTPYAETYPPIRELFKRLKIEFAEITGEIKNKKEQEDRFQNDPACRLMLANPKAGGVGINLTMASIAVWYLRDYSLGDRLQAEARCHRGGSEIHKSILNIDLVARYTLDETILNALKRKEDFANGVLQRIAELNANT